MIIHGENVTICHTFDIDFDHDIGDFYRDPQAKAFDKIMWRVRIMTPATPFPWRWGHNCFYYNSSSIQQKVVREVVLGNIR